ncbi:hypothetical protein PIB30_016110 [Stylosanthes scabra]|uniref:Uncharacterized protein n=1 Tax=Stylosanthes scabra TaxID=79078 RepID=A0ABU6R7G8_9FABA|nr:hypothetical protein [Stylosanthes scabra]
MTKFANQMLPSTSTPPPPPNSSPLPSQPLSNPKGGINVVEKWNEEKEKRKERTEWLIELIAKANEMVESDDEDWWDELDEEDSEDEDEEWEVEEENEVEVEVEKEDVIEEVVEKEQVNEALEEEAKIVEECGKLCLATIFEGEKVHKPILLVKCEDPRPCLVTCELDLGPLRLTKDTFTTAYMGIVLIAGIVEGVLVTIGSLSVPADFHVIRATRHSKGGTPQVLLGRPTLKTSGFKLDYITNTFFFKVGNIEKVYHPKRPPALKKKFAHQVQLSKEDKVEEKKGEEAKEKLKKGKGLRNSPPHVKKKKKDPMKKKVNIRKQGQERKGRKGKRKEKGRKNKRRKTEKEKKE